LLEFALICLWVRGMIMDKQAVIAAMCFCFGFCYAISCDIQLKRRASKINKSASAQALHSEVSRRS